MKKSGLVDEEGHQPSFMRQKPPTDYYSVSFELLDVIRAKYVFSHAKHPRSTAILAVVTRVSRPCFARKTAESVVRLNTYPVKAPNPGHYPLDSASSAE